MDGITSLVEKIHSTPHKAVLAVAGAGTQAVAALLAVSVTLTLIAVGVPVVFHVPATSINAVALLPVRLPPDAAMRAVLAVTPVPPIVMLMCFPSS